MENGEAKSDGPPNRMDKIRSRIFDTAHETLPSLSSACSVVYNEEKGNCFLLRTFKTIISIFYIFFRPSHGCKQRNPSGLADFSRITNRFCDSYKLPGGIL